MKCDINVTAAVSKVFSFFKSEKHFIIGSTRQPGHQLSTQTPTITPLERNERFSVTDDSSGFLTAIRAPVIVSLKIINLSKILF